MQEKGFLRKTRQRETILEVLRGTTSHPTADWVYQEVRKQLPNISLGTVYRNLKGLAAAGRVLELSYGSTFSRFDGNPCDHYHFGCTRCMRLFDVDVPVDSKLDEEAARVTGFDVTSHRLEFHGVCKDCMEGN